MNYGRAFRIIRAAFGLQQVQLSRLLRIGPSQLSLIEAGRRQPSLGVIEDLSNSLRIPKSLITLLASEQADIAMHDTAVINALAHSLLTLLVTASNEQIQPQIPFMKLER
jgi:transcriptional regulator with XRE-family HTH domain